MQPHKSHSNSGITGITRSPCQLTAPPGIPEGLVCRYGITMPFQISPTEAGIFANIRHLGARCTDWNYGNHLIIFNDLDHVGSGNVIPLNHNIDAMNPKTGKSAVMRRGPFIGGFVPLGAKRSDGTDHPHAGTGFALSYSNAHPVMKDISEPFSPLQGEEAYRYYELSQMSYDGKTVQLTDTLRLEPGEELLPGMSSEMYIRTAIPDGDDLIMTSLGGIVRWRRGAEGWRPVSYIEVTDGMPGFEGSLVRDVDGALLFSVRPSRSESTDTPTFQAILVWRSEDNGESWEKIIDVKNVRNGGPMTLNIALDGTPYVTANLSFQAFVKKDGSIGDCAGSSGYREAIMLWPLNEERTGLLSPFMVRWPRCELGPPPGGGSWATDHPVGKIVRLSDGLWHSILGYRILEWGENNMCFPPTPWSGAYVEEVLSSGEPRPAWNF